MVRTREGIKKNDTYIGPKSYKIQLLGNLVVNETFFQYISLLIFFHVYGFIFFYPNYIFLFLIYIYIYIYIYNNNNNNNNNKNNFKKLFFE